MQESKEKKELINDNYDEIDLIELLLPLFKNINFILRVCIYVFIISVLISFMLPKIYISSATILPPQIQSSISSQILTQLGGLAGGISLPQAKDTSELYKAFLQTNEVVDYVIEKNRLDEFYKEKNKESLRGILKNNLQVNIDRKSGLMKISYLSKSPEMAFNIVSSFIEGLKKLNNKLAVTEASQRRLFFEEQLEKAKENLIRAEEDLKKFQLKTGSIKIDDEAKAAIEEVSMIRAQISAKEIQLKVMKNYLTPENPEYKALVDEIFALKEQLSKLQSKIPDDDESKLSTKKVSVYGIEYIRKMREFKFSEAMYEFMLKQYESAKIDESKDAAIIQIVEKPEIPQKKYKPKRRVVVLLLTLVGFFLAVIWIYLKIFIENIKGSNPTLKDMAISSFLDWSKIKSDIKADIDKIRRLFKR